MKHWHYRIGIGKLVPKQHDHRIPRSNVDHSHRDYSLNGYGKTQAALSKKYKKALSKYL